MNVPSDRFNMPPNLNVQSDAVPQFTECVSTDAADKGRVDAHQTARRLQELIDQIQQQPNPAARVLLHECVQSLLALYGNGLTRIFGRIQDAGAGGHDILQQLLEDPAVSGLLLIHGLHPIPMETRLRQALEKVRPYMQSHGGNIELLSLQDDVAHVKLEGTCKSCPSSAITLELAVRRAVEEACPDLLGFEVVAANGEESVHSPQP
jgi:Fe-S cluster biogenesis protein NfuA